MASALTAGVGASNLIKYLGWAEKKNNRFPGLA